MFCLAPAGAGASAFGPWRRFCPPELSLQPVQLPGRENRINEPYALDPGEIAEAVRCRADRPYAIFGHSMGALVGFEVIHRLYRAGARLPTRFYPAATSPPDVHNPWAVRNATLPREQFIAELIALGGVPDSVREHPELLDLLLPVLRADFTWLAAARLTTEPPLPVPIDAFAGSDDEIGSAVVMAGWSRHTTAGFRLRTLPGGHFFPTTNIPSVLRSITASIAAENSGVSPQ